nr:hypothetical protein [Pseudopedobacter sp.]
MAESIGNDMVYGMSGSVGNMLVYRRRGNRTFVSRRPVINKNRVASAAQLAVQEKFKEGIIYSQTANAIPALKEAYALAATGNQTSYNRAFIDFQTPPSFSGQPDMMDYSGQIGDSFSVKAIDDFSVDRVHVRIQAADSSLIEEGEAVMDINGIDWKYTATQANATLAGTQLTFKAYDLPGNEAVLALTLN